MVQDTLRFLSSNGTLILLAGMLIWNMRLSIAVGRLKEKQKSAVLRSELQDGCLRTLFVGPNWSEVRETEASFIIGRKPSRGSSDLGEPPSKRLISDRKLHPIPSDTRAQAGYFVTAYPPGMYQALLGPTYPQ